MFPNHREEGTLGPKSGNIEIKFTVNFLPTKLSRVLISPSNQSRQPSTLMGTHIHSSSSRCRYSVREACTSEGPAQADCLPHALASARTCN